MKTKLLLLTLAAILLLSSSAFAEYDTLWTKYTHNISRLMFNKDDSKILTHGSGGIIIFDTETGEQIEQLSGKGIYNEDGSMIVALRETNVDVYDAETYDLIKTIPLSFHGTYDVSLLPDNKTLIAAGLGSINFVDFNSGELIHSIEMGDIQSWTYTKDSKYIIAATWYPSPKFEYGTLIFFNTKTYEKDYQIKGKTSHLRMSDDGTMLAFSNYYDDNIAVSIMDTDTKEIVGNIDDEIGVTDMRFSHDSKTLGISTMSNYGSPKNGIYIFDLSSFDVIRKLVLTNSDGLYYSFSNLDYSYDNMYIVGSTGQRLVVFDNSINNIKDNSVPVRNVYPNPTTNLANLEFEVIVPTDILLTLTNSQGSEIDSIPFGYYYAGNNIIQYDCSKLSNGVYFLTLTGKSFKKTYKLMKI